MLMLFVQVFVLILQLALAEPNFRVSKCVSTIVRWERIIYRSGTKSKGAKTKMLDWFDTHFQSSPRWVWNKNNQIRVGMPTQHILTVYESWYSKIKFKICFFSCCNPGQPAGQHPFRWETWQKKVKTSSLVKRQGNVNKKYLRRQHSIRHNLQICT